MVVGVVAGGAVVGGRGVVGEGGVVGGAVVGGRGVVGEGSVVALVVGISVVETATVDRRLNLHQHFINL